MRANVTRLRTTRRYSEEFKRKIVNDFSRGRFSVTELSKLHNLEDRTIYRWINKYSDQSGLIEIVEMKKSSTQRVKDMESRIKELERAVGQKQLYIDYLEKMMEIAKEDMGVDIKKNYDTPQSVGSGKTRKR